MEIIGIIPTSVGYTDDVHMIEWSETTRISAGEKSLETKSTGAERG